jgi:hypothetical protein
MRYCQAIFLHSMIEFLTNKEKIVQNNVSLHER